MTKDCKCVCVCVSSFYELKFVWLSFFPVLQSVVVKAFLSLYVSECLRLCRLTHRGEKAARDIVQFVPYRKFKEVSCSVL